MSKFSRKFSQNSRKCKLKKGRKNLYEILGKLYVKCDKILNKICEIGTNFENTRIFVDVLWSII